MTDKKKKRARALSTKTGMSHQAAINVLATSRRQSGPPLVSPIVLLLQHFWPSHVSSIGVGRLPAVGRSAVAAIAAERARQLAEHPVYFAETRRISQVVSFDEMAALIQRGATLRGDIQVVRVAPPQKIAWGREVECASCHRFFACGSTGEGACKCGQRFVVSHDGEEDHGVLEGRRCMDCGVRNEMTAGDDHRGPWRVVNERQSACGICSAMSHIGPRGGLRRLTG